ncbi:hypothetical protein [Streptomyces sp. FH025]|uniref:hypothetical protein n=1 Tax=Streptomyces sp. FH025 TaxID=2815937 RepID=UPI001A9CC6E2|nr:hypothetical protein [Streptomyces sp. FH025]MBO1415038.1 hypothetical protein [Streptomyces sp. FH025]
MNLSIPIVMLVVVAVFSAIRFGLVVTAWSALGLVVFLAPFFVLSLRAWSRVGRDGVTICWGFGRRGRTYPWSEVQWIDVRELRGNGTSSYAVRLFLTGGRRRSLPGLQTSTMYPIEEFEVHFQRVLDWWEASTHESQRIRPGKQARDRFTPRVAGALLAVVIVVVVYFVFAARQ